MAVRSLAGRLVVGATVWLSVAVAVGGVVLAGTFRESMESSFEQRLDALLRAVVAGLEIGADGDIKVFQPMGEPRFDQIHSGWYWQVSDGDEIMLRSRSLGNFAFDVESGPPGGGLHQRHADGPRYTQVLLVERDFAFPHRSRRLHIAVAASFSEVEAAVSRFNTLLTGSLGMLALGLLVAVALQVHYGLRPMRRLTADLERIGNDGNARLGDDYPREVAPLVAAMNAVLDHDTELVERARTHVGNLAHALKTPLAVIRTECRPGGNPAVVAANAEVMGRLVEHHLARARSTASSAGALGMRTSVAPVIEELVGMMERIHADKDLVFERHIPPEVKFPGDREDLVEICGELLENACKWAASRIILAAASEPGKVLSLTVEDDGPGLTPEAAEAVSRRGARLDENTPGSGLGLAIVGDLISLYGGNLAFGKSPSLNGLQVRVTLPDATTWKNHLAGN